MKRKIFFDGIEVSESSHVRETDTILPLSKNPVRQHHGLGEDLPMIKGGNQVSEMRQAMDSLDDDSPGLYETSKLDKNTNLPINAIESYAPIDICLSMHALPKSASVITLVMKNLMISKDGWGREQKTRIAVGMQGQLMERKLSMFDRIRGLFNRGGGIQ